MRKVFAICLCAVLVLTSCGEYNYVVKSPDYEYRYEAAKAYFVQGQYTKASELFGSVIGVLKGTALGEESLYLLGQSEFCGKDWSTASNYFKKYYQSYPKGTYVEQAHYYTGLALYNQIPDSRLDQTSTVDAMAELQNFLDLYPYTTLKDQTHEMLLKLQDKLVEKECLSARLYYDLGDYVGNSINGGSNYEACVVTARNALNDYPYARPEDREFLSILILRSKYHLAKSSVEDKKLERYRDTVDEYYAFINDYPESKYLKEAKRIFTNADAIIKNNGVDVDEK